MLGLHGEELPHHGGKGRKGGLPKPPLKGRGLPKPPLKGGMLITYSVLMT